jgi:hypothetical protein
MLLKKYSDFGGGKKKVIWFRVFDIWPNVKFWKKISRFARQKKKNILTLVLSENIFLNEKTPHRSPLQVKWSIPNPIHFS